MIADVKHSEQTGQGLDRILIIRPSALGDVARTVPALVSLRRAYPKAAIDWLVDAGFEPAIERHPDLSAAITFPKKTIKTAMKRGNAGPLREFVRGLRARRYDAVFDLQGLARSGMVAMATGAPKRYGLREAREFAWLAYTHRGSAGIEMHTVERMLAVVAAAGAEPVRDMRLYSSEEARGWRDGVAGLGPAGGPYAVLAPTSRWPAKQWPAERFAAVAEWLLGRGLTVVFVGAGGEEPQVGPVVALCERETRAKNLIGRTSVAQLMALIEGAAVVVANDSAALHIAVGFSRPIVALFGPTRVNRVGPFGRDADVIQHVLPGDSMRHKDPGGAGMMGRISVEEVVSRVEARVAQG